MRRTVGTARSTQIHAAAHAPATLPISTLTGVTAQPIFVTAHSILRIPVGRTHASAPATIRVLAHPSALLEDSRTIPQAAPAIARNRKSSR